MLLISNFANKCQKQRVKFKYFQGLESGGLFWDYRIYWPTFEYMVLS